MGRLVLGIVIGAGAMYAAFNYHVVRANDGFQLVRKQTAALSEVYMDIRSYGPNEWAAHRELAADLIAAGKGNLMAESAGGTLVGGVQGMFDMQRR